MESTWAAIKRDLLHIHGPFEQHTRSQMRTVLFDYIETFYNQKRMHSATGYVSPAQFERNALRAA